MITIILTREETSNLLLCTGPGQTSDPDHITLVIQRHPQILQHNRRTVSYHVLVGFLIIQVDWRQLHIKASTKGLTRCPWLLMRWLNSDVEPHDFVCDNVKDKRSNKIN